MTTETPTTLTTTVTTTIITTTSMISTNLSTVTTGNKYCFPKIIFETHPFKDIISPTLDTTMITSTNIGPSAETTFSHNWQTPTLIGSTLNWQTPTVIGIIPNWETPILIGSTMTTGKK